MHHPRTCHATIPHPSPHSHKYFSRAPANMAHRHHSCTRNATTHLPLPTHIQFTHTHIFRTHLWHTHSAHTHLQHCCNSPRTIPPHTTQHICDTHMQPTYTCNAAATPLAPPGPHPRPILKISPKHNPSIAPERTPFPPPFHNSYTATLGFLAAEGPPLTFFEPKNEVPAV